MALHAACASAASYPESEDWGWLLEHSDQAGHEFRIGCFSSAEHERGCQGRPVARSVFVRPYVSIRERLKGISHAGQVEQWTPAMSRARWIPVGGRRVRRVRFEPAMQWFLLDTDAGTKVRISAFSMGLPEFARLVLLRVAGRVALMVDALLRRRARAGGAGGS